MTLSPIIVIPARMASTRLPGKPLADIGGTPMIVHVWRRACEAGVGRVVVAAAEPEIAAVIDAAGGESVLTRPDLASGSDRIHEAVETVDPEKSHDVVVNLQGDLPTIPPAQIRAVLDPLADESIDIATLVAEITDPAERDDTSVNKVAVAFPPGATVAPALYFSRTAIPSGAGPLWHHIGIYAFRRAALARFVALPPSGLEQREKLEQLRALEAGMRIAVARVDAAPIGVDTPADLERARRMLADG
ncbi:MAG: 3-deoxy-manno-octulosonate cytidylyltransferase [Alphaproteobacteria bacterium]|nr:3-deoxy-manno-octulosonate cytidylyltransferase [Alphaproteobacteria bacterium]